MISQVHVLLQEKEKWSKDKFEIANKAKSEASRLSSMENEAAEKAKYVPVNSRPFALQECCCCMCSIAVRVLSPNYVCLIGAVDSATAGTL